MKKLLVTAISAAVALGAYAGDISTLRFEGMERANTTPADLNAIQGTYWTAPGDATDNEYKIAAAGSVNCPRQTAFVEAPTNSLSIKTTFGKPLSVNVVNGGAPTNITEKTGIYFDSLVNFTVCDAAPEKDYDGAKIMMWLQEEYAADGETVLSTNLMVKAGYLSYEGGQLQVSNVVYKCQDVNKFGGDFAGTDKWHRVTIRAIKNITTGSTVIPGFVIYIDGNKSDYSFRANCDASQFDSTFTTQYTLTTAAADLKAAHALFPSMVQTGGSKLTLECASFDGTGSVTDILFTDATPEFVKDAEELPKAVVNIGGKSKTYTTVEDAIDAINDFVAEDYITASLSLVTDLTLENQIEFNNEYVEVVFDFAGYTITSALDDAAIVNYAPMLTIKDSSLSKTGGILCTGSGDAVYNGETLVIEGGIFRGNLNLDDGFDTGISGGSFQQGPDDIGDYVDPTMELVYNGSTGLYDVVDKPKYDISFVYGYYGEYTNVVSTVEGFEPEFDGNADIVEGYKFTGWDPEKEVATSNTTYVAQYTRSGFDPDAGNGTQECDTPEDAAQLADDINTDKENKITLPAYVDSGDPDAVQAYYDSVEAAADGTTVSLVFTAAGEAAAQASADDAMEEIPLDEVASEGAVVEIETVPGFYYSVLSGATPQLGDADENLPRTAGTGGSVNLAFPKVGTAGFYQIRVSPVSKAAPAPAPDPEEP